MESLRLVDAILELLLQFLFEVVGEFLIEAGFHGAARVLRSRAGRFIVAAGAGLAAGFWWGARLTKAGRVQAPRALWVSVALAILFGVGALWRWRRGPRPGDDTVISPPWRWPAYRLVGFALLNGAVAAGIALGFNPQPLG